MGDLESCFLDDGPLFDARFHLRCFQRNKLALSGSLASRRANKDELLNFRGTKGK